MSIALGLPKRLLPTPEVAMSAGSSSQLVRVQPNNVSSVSGAASLPTGTANAATNSLAFPSQMVNFSVPCGAGRNVWIDSSKSTLSFKVTYAIAAPTYTTAYAAGSAYLQGAASSFFNRIVAVGGQGQVLDDVVNLHVSEHINQLLNLNAPDRDCFAASYGFGVEAGENSANNSVQGHSIPAISGTFASATNVYSYDFPLPSALLGKYARSMFPAGSINKLDIQLYTNSFMPITVHIGTAAGAPAPTLTVTISDLALNLYYITLDTESSRLLGAPRIHSIHGITQRTATAQLPAGSTGYLTSLIGLRGKSVRSLHARIVDQGTVAAAAVATGVDQAINGWADSKALIASQMNYLIGGKDRYPNYPANTLNAPASVFTQTLMSSEMYELWKQHSSFMPNQYFKFAVGQTATAGTCDQRIIDAGSKSKVADLCTFLFSQDLRKASSSEVLDGVDLSATANTFLELNLPSGCTNAQTIYYTAFLDIIFECDLEAGTVQFRM